MKVLLSLGLIGVGPLAAVVAQSAPVGSDSGLVGLLTGSAVTVLAAAVLAFVRGWVVPGRTHDRITAENDILREEIRNRNKDDRETLIPMIVESMTQALKQERGAEGGRA